MSYYYLPPYSACLMRMELSATPSCTEQSITMHSSNYGIIANVTGTVNDTVSTYAVPNPSINTLGAASVADTFLCGTAGAVGNVTLSPHFGVYPNPLPAGASLRVLTEILGADATLELFDVSGRVVYSKRLHEPLTTIENPGLQAGLYIARLTQGQLVSVQKVVVVQ
jgi:hypothetical protein